MNNYLNNLLAANRKINPVALVAIAGLFLYLLSGMRANNIFNFVLLIISVVAHELAHGLAALYCGDDTAKKYGRLSLNPLKHLDPMGTILPLILMLMGSGFLIGWAKPVPVNSRNFKSFKKGNLIVSLAGVVTNFTLALIGLFVFYQWGNTFSPFVTRSLIYFVQINNILGVFNLLPIPPLDGSKLLLSTGNKSMINYVLAGERYGTLIILALGLTGILGAIMIPLVRVLLNLQEFLVLLIIG